MLFTIALFFRGNGGGASRSLTRESFSTLFLATRDTVNIPLCTVLFGCLLITTTKKHPTRVFSLLDPLIIFTVSLMMETVVIGGRVLTGEALARALLDDGATECHALLYRGLPCRGEYDLYRGAPRA
jgi:hypothetical protein